MMFLGEEEELETVICMSGHRREYINGFSKSGRLMRKEDQPRLKYNKTKKIWTLYYAVKGKDISGKDTFWRTRVSFDSFEDFKEFPKIVEFEEVGIILNNLNFQEAKRSGVSYLKAKPKRTGTNLSEEFLERCEINLRYYAKHKAKYEFFRLYKEMKGKIDDSVIEKEYEMYVAKYYKENRESAGI